MIWHIVRRELLDHLTSLRFGLTTFILVALMVTNAVVHLQTHPERVRRYSEKVNASQTELKSRTELYALLQKGPGKLYKRPASLAFIADGGDALLPDESVSGGFWRLYDLSYIWSLGVPRLNMEAISNFRPTATVIDWVFIVTYLLSFIPLLFTFDALSGERERGTLRLCLANSISRPTLLMGKFLGSLITVPHRLLLCRVVQSRHHFYGKLDAVQRRRLGTCGTHRVDCFLLCWYLHRNWAYHLRHDPGKSVKSRCPVAHLGDRRGIYAINPRGTLHKMDAARSNTPSISGGKRDYHRPN